MRRLSRASADGFGAYVQPQIAAALRENFSISAPNAMQREVLVPALSGQDILLQAQTGSGKTLAFLLPLIERLARASAAKQGSQLHTALVLAPTQVLVEQHAKTARSLVASLEPALHVGMETDFSAALVDDASSPQLLVSTPRALLRRLALGKAALQWMSQLVVVAFDECDALLCGSAYDDKLTDEAVQLLSLVPTSSQCLLATAYLSMQHELALGRRFRHAIRVAEPSAAGKPTVMVPTLRQVFNYMGPDADRNAALVSSLRSAEVDPWLQGGTTMVFCESASALSVHAHLSAAMPHLKPSLLIDDVVDLRGDSGDPHRQGRKESVMRPESAISEFIAGRSRVLVCTGVAARGLDFPALRHVVLYDMPTSVAGFVHSAGRTARRGSRGLVTCLVESEEEVGRFQDLHALLPARALDFS